MTESIFSIKACYSLAWKSFRKWWIPLCLISSFILLFEIVPRLLLRPETAMLKQAVIEAVSTIQTGTFEEIDVMVVDLQKKYWIYFRKLSKMTGVVFPLGALLSMILLLWANTAVKDRRTKIPARRMLYITAVHLPLAFIKVLAFLFFVLPGVYLYVRLFFVTLILLEEKDQGVVYAVKKSWQMSQGHLWELIAIFCMNGIVQMVMVPTVIGLIPITGFANTARAAAYQMIKDSKIELKDPLKS